MLIEQPRNTAMPLAAVLVNPLVHDSVAPAGLAPMDRVTTVELSPVTIMLRAFSTTTTGCWAQTAPAAPPPGWVVKTRCCVDPPEPTVPGLPRFVPRQSATVCVIVVPATWVETPTSIASVCWPATSGVAAVITRGSTVSANLTPTFRPPVGAKPHGELTSTTTPAASPLPTDVWMIPLAVVVGERMPAISEPDITALIGPVAAPTSAEMRRPDTEMSSMLALSAPPVVTTKDVPAGPRATVE